MKKNYQIWVAIESTRCYGQWIEVSFNTYNNFIKELILANYEITTEQIGLHEFVKANDILIASVSERRF